MPGAPDTLPIRVLKTVSDLVSLRPGPAGCPGPVIPGAREAIEVGARLGSRGFVAGPPGLAVQLDHGVGPGCGWLRGGCGGRGSQGAVGLGANAADGCGALGLARRLPAVHLVAHEEHEDEDQHRGHDDPAQRNDHRAAQEGCVRGATRPQRRLSGEAGAAHGPRGREPGGAILIHSEHAQIVGPARCQVGQQEGAAVRRDHPGGAGRWGQVSGCLALALCSSPTPGPVGLDSSRPLPPFQAPEFPATSTPISFGLTPHYPLSAIPLLLTNFTPAHPLPSL